MHSKERLLDTVQNPGHLRKRLSDKTVARKGWFLDIQCFKTEIKERVEIPKFRFGVNIGRSEPINAFGIMNVSLILSNCIPLHDFEYVYNYLMDAQVVSDSITGDHVLSAAYAHDLPHFGLEGALDGGHIAAYMNTLIEDEPEKYQTVFSQYIKKGIEANNISRRKYLI
ncbi:60S ribosomal protein l5 [Phtheirospermum japonicum]|uniref:60S ribosomal protein l5 n=1 Tax=Phtheirospermum japonicum TaxID=374723 RepID=A0A830CS38_9LAMI|nr:60S ribosomal protein l5 [Phtheirospermum japonicum]